MIKKYLIIIGLLMGLCPIQNLVFANEFSGNIVKQPVAIPANSKLIQYLHNTFALPYSKALKIVAEAYKNAMEQHIHPALVLAIISVESTFKDHAHNGNAVGLMQVIPRYHPNQVAEIGGVKRLYEPANNIRVGTIILHDYIVENDGNLRAALARYSGSYPSQVNQPYFNRVMSRYKKIKAMMVPEFSE